MRYNTMGRMKYTHPTCSLLQPELVMFTYPSQAETPKWRASPSHSYVNVRNSQSTSQPEPFTRQSSPTIQPSSNGSISKPLTTDPAGRWRLLHPHGYDDDYSNPYHCPDQDNLGQGRRYATLVSTGQNLNNSQQCDIAFGLSCFVHPKSITWGDDEVSGFGFSLKLHFVSVRVMTLRIEGTMGYIRFRDSNRRGTIVSILVNSSSFILRNVTEHEKSSTLLL